MDFVALETRKAQHPGGPDAMAFAVQRNNVPPFAAQQPGKGWLVVLFVITAHEDQIRRRKVRHVFRTFLQPGHP
jgi:hypothetical protein